MLVRRKLGTDYWSRENGEDFPHPRLKYLQKQLLCLDAVQIMS